MKTIELDARGTLRLFNASQQKLVCTDSVIRPGSELFRVDMINQGQPTVSFELAGFLMELKFIPSRNMWACLRPDRRYVRFLTLTGQSVSIWSIFHDGRQFDIDDQHSLIYIASKGSVAVHRYDGQPCGFWELDCGCEHDIRKILVHPTRDLIFLECRGVMRVYSKQGVFLYDFKTNMRILLEMSLHVQRNFLILAGFELVCYSFEGRCLSHVRRDYGDFCSIALDEERDLLYVQKAHTLFELDVYSL